MKIQTNTNSKTKFPLSFENIDMYPANSTIREAWITNNKFKKASLEIESPFRTFAALKKNKTI